MNLFQIILQTSALQNKDNTGLRYNFFKLKSKNKNPKKPTEYFTYSTIPNIIVSPVYKTEVCCTLSLYTFAVWCVLYWHLISNLVSAWTSFIVRTKYPHELTGKEGHRAALPTVWHMCYRQTPWRLSTPSSAGAGRKQWGGTRLTRDKWQLKGAAMHHSSGKENLFPLELSRMSHSLSYLHCVVASAPPVTLHGEGTIPALFAIITPTLGEWRSTTRNTEYTEFCWMNEHNPCTDYQAKLACQFLLQCFPIVKTYSTLSQWKQCITVFLIVSSSLTNSVMKNREIPH